jgi:hypothetical protein
MDLQKVKEDAKLEIVRFIGLHEWSPGERWAATYTGFHTINHIFAELEEPADEDSEQKQGTHDNPADEVEARR